MTKPPNNEQSLPTFSIVTISYNQGDYLERAITSILDQSYPNVEYILIDGDSDDHSREIIARYADQIDYWCSEPDQGPTHALNKGLEQATGDVFGFINADDYLLPDALRRIAPHFGEDDDIDVVYGHGHLVDADGDLLRPLYSLKWDLNGYLMDTVTILQQATFVRLEKMREVGGFAEDNQRCWDGELWVDLALHDATWKRIDEMLGAWRIHDESINGSDPELLDNGLSRYEMEQRRLVQRVLGEGAYNQTNRLKARVRAWLDDPLVRFQSKLATIRRKVDQLT
jgi:glycosyltransferase involved in cell wall biosynthesis